MISPAAKKSSIAKVLLNPPMTISMCSFASSHAAFAQALALTKDPIKTISDSIFSKTLTPFVVVRTKESFLQSYSFISPGEFPSSNPSMVLPVLSPASAASFSLAISIASSGVYTG